jgi:hypothetical protein
LMTRNGCSTFAGTLTLRKPRRASIAT